MRTREGLAWAAGFYEGEGNILFTLTSNHGRDRRVRRVIIQINQVDQEPLERFRAAVGMGAIYGPTTKAGNRQPQFHYQVGRFEEVQAIICFLWPWLSARRRGQILAALQAYRSYSLLAD